MSATEAATGATGPGPEITGSEITGPEITDHEITVVRVLAATPARLYAAWTEPEQMRRWFATVVDADVRVGGRYRYELTDEDGTTHGWRGEYLALEPGERVAFTFVHDASTPADGITGETVTITFRELDPGRTEVTLVNRWTGPGAEPDYYAALRGGWDEWYTMLERHLTGRVSA